MRSLASDPVIGVAVPRSRRSGGRVPRSWRTSVLQLLDLVEETVLEDEREALEALCFLSAGSCELPDAVLGSSLLPVPAKQQHSKGSSLTAEVIDVPDSRTVAVTSRRHSGRLPSPGSDVSSGGSQGAVLHPQQQLQLPETLPLPLDEIHPGAHPVDIQQLVPASTQHKQQQQPPRQHQHLTGSKKRKQSTAHQQPAPEAVQQQQQQPERMDGYGAQLQLGALALPGSSTRAVGHLEGLNAMQSNLPLPGMPTEQYGMLGQAALDSTLLSADTAAPYQAAAAAVQHAATGFHQPALAPQLGPLLQPGNQQLAAAAAAGLNPTQLAALAAAAAVGSSTFTNLVQQHCQQQQPQGLPELLAQLLVSSGWPATAVPMQSHVIAPQPMWPAHRQPAVKCPPVKTGSWHVYIANMIAKGRQNEQQQQSGGGDAAELPVGEPAAAAATSKGSPSKRHKRQQTTFEQQPAVHQALAPALPDLVCTMGGTAGMAPSLAHTLVVAAAAAAAAGQSGSVPGLPAVAQSHPLAGFSLAGPVAPGALPIASSGLAPEVLLQLLGAPRPAGLGPAPVSLPGSTSFASGNPAMPQPPGFARGAFASMPGAAVHHLTSGVHGAAVQQLQALQLTLPGLGLVAQ